MYGELPCETCGQLFVPRTETGGRALETQCPGCQGYDNHAARVVDEARKVREADVSDGSRVPHGSSKHVRDLKARIKSLAIWRDKQKKGSEARANYARLISRLKSELASAQRAAAKKRGEK